MYILKVVTYLRNVRGTHTPILPQVTVHSAVQEYDKITIDINVGVAPGRRGLKRYGAGSDHIF
jgi:hypothetical protein